MHTDEVMGARLDRPLPRGRHGLSRDAVRQSQHVMSAFEEAATSLIDGDDEALRRLRDPILDLVRQGIDEPPNPPGPDE